MGRDGEWAGKGTGDGWVGGEGCIYPIVGRVSGLGHLVLLGFRICILHHRALAEFCFLREHLCGHFLARRGRVHAAWGGSVRAELHYL